MKKLQAVSALLRQTFTNWKNDGGPRLGASLSFYTAFSLAPLLLLSISMAGFFLGHDFAQSQIMDELRTTMGTRAAQAIQNMLELAQNQPSTPMTPIVGFVTLLLGASGVMGDLKYTLNRIWRVTAPTGFTVLIKDKLLSVCMVLAVGFLLLVSLMASMCLAAFGRYIESMLPIARELLYLLNFIFSFAFITLLFAAIFKVLPNTTISWRDVWVGAAITSLLFTIGKSLLGIYLGKGPGSSSYGAAESVLVLLLWLYYSAQILYFGAEFTRVYSGRHETS